MERSDKNSREEIQATQVFQLIITNPCSEPSEPIEIACIVNDLSKKSKHTTTNTLPTEIGDNKSDQYVTSTVPDEILEGKNQVHNSSKVDSSEDLISTVNNVNNTEVDTGRTNLSNTEANIGKVLNTNKETESCNKTIENSDKDVSVDSDVELCEPGQHEISRNTSHKCLEKVTNANKRIESETSNSEIISKKATEKDCDSDIELHEVAQSNSTADSSKENSVIVLDSITDSEKTINLDKNEIINLPENPAIDLASDDTDISKRPWGTIKYDDIFKENPLLMQLVETCLTMEKNGGMHRVINRTLLSIYKNVSEHYKKSEDFRKVLIKTLNQLDKEPEWKYSHIKCLCDHLKTQINKKRASLVTLGKSTDSGIFNKKRRVETIDLDNYSGSEENKSNQEQQKPKEYPPIEIDDDSSNEEEVILVENNKENKIKNKSRKKRNLAAAFIPNLVRNPFCTRPIDKDKQPTVSDCTIQPSNEDDIIPIPQQPPNHKSVKSIKIPVPPNPAHRLKNPVQRNEEDTQFLEPALALQHLPVNIEDQEIPITNPITQNQPLLEVMLMEPVPLHPLSQKEDLKNKEIKIIEEQIAFLDKYVKELDKLEVTSDSVSSPYVMSEQVEVRIVKLYKRLCELTGSVEKKQHKVRLQALPGHHEGPVRCLEEFLNSNIDADGNTPFPDMEDVINCVRRANALYNMNWGHSLVELQARSLFVQFGRTMQKRRQRREWKDLMLRAREEVDDPADNDPQLMMKLEYNSMIAKKNEEDLLQRYANMERDAKVKHTGLPDLLVLPLDALPLVDDNDDSDTDDDHTNTTPENTVTVPNCIENPVSIAGNSTQNKIIGNCMKLLNGQIVMLPLSNALSNTQYIIHESIKSGTTNIVHQNIGIDTRVISQNQMSLTAPVTKNLDITEVNTPSTSQVRRDSIEKPSYIGSFAQFVLNENNKEVTTRRPNAVDKISFSRNIVEDNVVDKVLNKEVASTNITVVENDSVGDPSALAKNILQLILKDCPDLQTNNKNSDANTTITIKTEDETNENTVPESINEEMNKKTRISSDDRDEGKVESSEDALLNSVKPEPLDIPKMLNDLGEDYTAVVYDIEDPFLVIEISDDSSESEEESDVES